MKIEYQGYKIYGELSTIQMPMTYGNFKEKQKEKGE